MYENYLKNIREYYGLSTSAFAEKFGYNQPTYYRYEKGTNQIPQELLSKLEQENINLHYLFTGQGQMFLSGESNTKQPKENDKILKNYKFFGYRLAELQDELGYLDKAMARLMGIDEKKYIRIKLGDEGATVEQLVSLASKVDVSLDWLIKGE